MARIAILTEGRTNYSDAKTACGLIRYRGDEVVGLIDSTLAGKTTQDVLGIGGDTPLVSRLEDLDADTLVIGIAPAGGALPGAWREILIEACERGMTILSGLHTFLLDDAELRSLAEKHGATIHDVRRPPDDLTVSRNIAKDTPCFRVHTVGLDCNVGKMSASLEITTELNRREKNAVFVPTGQTGILISGRGLPIDRVISDFVAGATEQLVLEHQDADFVVIEGQGSLVHPLYSGVTLGLLHGCAPQAMVMCYEAGSHNIRHVDDCPIPPLEELVTMYETLAGVICPSRVVGFCSNTRNLNDEEARRELESVEDRMGLPVTDPYRYGVDRLVDAIMQEAAATA